MNRQSESLLSAHMNGIEGMTKAYGNAKALDVTNVNERGAIVVASFN